MKLEKSTRYGNQSDPFGIAKSFFGTGFEDFFNWPYDNNTYGYEPTAERFGVDLYEDENNIYVLAELPGVDKKAVRVTMVGDLMTIEVEVRKADKESGRPASYAKRTVHFQSDVNREKIRASFENGIVKVTVPKVEEAKPRQIEIA